MTTTESADNTRHQSAILVAMEIYPQMAIKMINNFPPNLILRMIENDANDKFRKSLNKSQKKLLPTLRTDGFNKLDISFLCHLIQHFNLVLTPSENWGRIPLATNINQGDDVERMRNNCNFVLHRPKVSLSEEEGDTFFKESIDIAHRVDNFNDESIDSFATQIQNAMHNPSIPEQSRQILEMCPAFQVQLRDIPGIRHVDLYYDDVIGVILGNQDLPATDSTRYTIYIRGGNINYPAIREKLEQLKKSLNEGSYEIKLVKAESGSLVLHVEIKNLCFRTKDSLHKAIAEFLQRVFTSINVSLEQQHIMTVVLAECDSYIISDNEEENDDYSNNQESLVLKLGRMAMTSQHVDEGAECTALLDDKDARATQEDKTCGISTYSPSQGISHGKNPEEACSKMESEKGSSGKKNRIDTMHICKEEKILILSSYNSLTYKSFWKQLMDIVYEKHNDVLPNKVINHYEYLYKEGALQDRIKHYIERVNSVRAIETDPDIMPLVTEMKSKASPPGKR